MIPAVSVVISDVYIYMADQKLKKILAPFLAAEELSVVVRGWDLVGDLCIISIPESLVTKEQLIARTILAQVRGVRMVLKRVGNYEGEFRTLSMQRLAGTGDVETIHKEYGIRLRVRPEDVYFSPRSSGERYRVAQCVREGENVLVMFSGIAPFPLMISKYSAANQIIAVEKNPVAHHLACKNIASNRGMHNIMPLPGDVTTLVPKLEKKFSRIIMVLPGKGRHFLGTALSALVPGGILHYYTFSKKDMFDQTIKSFTADSEELGRGVGDIVFHKCGHVAPGKYRVCLDATVW